MTKGYYIALPLMWVGSALAGKWGLSGWRFAVVLAMIYTAGILTGISLNEQ